MFNILEVINSIGPCIDVVCGPVIPLAAFLAPSLISAGSSLISNLFNIGSTRKTNDTNMAINQQNLDFTAAMTRQAWERDDNAHQREVRDLEAAGLSPLANTTGSQVTAPNSAPSPIAMQAPQIDSTSLANSILQAGQLHENIRHNKVLEGQKDTELTNQAEQIKVQAEQVQVNNKRVEADIKYQADLIELQNNQLEELIRSNKSNEDIKKAAYISEKTFKEIEHQLGGEKLPYKPYYVSKGQTEIYVNALKLWEVSYKNWQKTHTEPIKGSEGENTSQSLNGGFGLGAGAAGPSGNINAGESTSKGKYKSWDNYDTYMDDKRKFYTENPKPVLID